MKTMSYWVIFDVESVGEPPIVTDLLWVSVEEELGTE